MKNLAQITILAIFFATSVQSDLAAQTLLDLTDQGEDAPETENQEDGQDGPDPLPEFKRPFTVLGPRLPEEITPVETVARPGARLRQLDKMTGATRTFEVGAGETREGERLSIRLAACRAPEDNAVHGTKAFLKIWDRKYDRAEPDFSGWMFAESPALSALDHPRFDVWVISCTTSEGAVASGSE